MQKKAIKKIVDAKITKQEWKRLPKTGAKGYYYRCEGEVRNTGFSEIKELVVICAVYKKGRKKLLTFITKKFRVHKSAGYFAVFNLNPNESTNFIVTLNLPSPSEVIWGRFLLKNIDAGIKEGILIQKTFLHYDKKLLDGKTKKWFRFEEIRKIKILDCNWDVRELKSENTVMFICKGTLKNTGNFDFENAIITSYIKIVETDVPLKWVFKKRKPKGEFFDEIEEKDEEQIYETKGQVVIPLIKANSTAEFNGTIKLPDFSIIERSEWRYEKIMNGLEKGILEYAIDIGYESESGILVYRDTLEDPTLIQEVKENRKVDVIGEEWILQREGENRKYNCKGMIKNTGNVDIHNIYVISSILDPKKNEPIMWESGSESFKTLEIEKVDFLKIRETKTFQIDISLPDSKGASKSDISAQKIIDMVESGSLRKKVNVYYESEDVNEEGFKRLNLGNAYFRLGNFGAAIKEYNEGIKLIPDEKMLYFNLGLTYYKVFRLNDSLEAFKNALKVDSRYLKAIYFEGLVYMKLKEWDNAIERLRAALSVDEKNEKICFNISCCYMEKESKREGYEWLKKAIALNRPVIVNKTLKDPEFEKFRRDSDFIEIIKGKS